MDTPIPTTYADITAAGWFSGASPAGYRFRSIVIGDYEIVIHTDGGGVSLYRRDSAIQISEADAVALATKIAALLRGEPSADDLRRMHANLTLASVGQDASGAAALAPRIEMAREKIIRLSRDRDEIHAKNERLTEDIAQALAERDAAIANLAKAETRITEAHAALDEAGAPAGCGVLSERINLLAADRDQSNRFLDSAVKERDYLRNAIEEANATNGRLASDLAQAQAENAALRSRLAERPTPPDPRDPPVSTAAEEAIDRLWDTLLNKASIERDDFATAASGDPAGELLDLADAVEAALDRANEQIRTISEERGHATHLAMEQFRHRLYRT